MLNSATKQTDRYFLLLLGELDYLLRPLVMVFVNRRLEGRSSRLLNPFQQFGSPPFVRTPLFSRRIWQGGTGGGNLRGM